MQRTTEKPRSTVGRARRRRTVFMMGARRAPLGGWLALLLTLATLPAAACAQQSPQTNGPDGGGSAGAKPAGGPDLIPGLAGLDHVVVAVNDLRGAIAAYQRLGFSVIPLETPAGGGPGGLVDLGNGFIEFVTPAADSTGQVLPFTFEGGLGQGWEIASTKDLKPYFKERGEVGDAVPGTFAPVDSAGRVSPPSAEASGPTFTLSEPRNQPVSGTSIYFVQYDQPRFRRLFDEILQKTGMSDPTQHANGAVELAYVTVAVSRVEATLEVLKSWGLEPKPAVDDERGARSIEVDLPRGKVFLVEPKTGGGISDFLEERRAKAPPVGNRYFEGVILSIGIGVENLGKTIDWLTDKKIPYNPMRLPNGTVEVVQGAPGWALRLEFVQADQDRDKRWAAHREEGRSASAAGSGADASGSASGEDGSR